MEGTTPDLLLWGVAQCSPLLPALVEQHKRGGLLKKAVAVASFNFDFSIKFCLLHLVTAHAGGGSVAR